MSSYRGLVQYRFMSSLVVWLTLVLSTSGIVSAAPVNLSFWFYVAGPNFDNVKTLVGEFNKQNPDVQVEATLVTDWTTKLPVAAAAGVPPDVVWMPWISTGTYASQNLIVNLDDIMKREGKLAAYSKDFFPSLWETSKTNGQVYALPFDTNNMLMYYNRDILNKYGVPEPSDKWTWDDFVKSAKRISSPPDRYAFSAINDWRHFVDFLGALNGRVISPDGTQVTINNPAAYEALQFMMDVMHSHQIAPMPDAPVEVWRTGFANGLLAYEVQGSYRLPQYSQLGTTNLGAVAQPQRTARYSSTGGESLVIMKTNSTREAAAWRFVDWITGTYANAWWSAASGYLPVRRSSMAHGIYQDILRNDPLRRRFAEELTYGDRLPAVAGADKVFSILGTMVTKAVNKTLTPQQAIADAELALKAALKLP